MDSIHYEVKHNVRLGDYSYLFLSEGLYESQYTGSYFLKLYNKNHNDTVSFVVGMDGSVPVSILLFHKYPLENKELNSRTKNSFQFKGKQIIFLCMGLVGIYVKPVYRNSGIAHKMASIFKSDILPSLLDEYSNSNQQVIVATDYTNKILKRLGLPVCISEFLRSPIMWQGDIYARLKYGIGTHIEYFD